jgi:integrase
MDSLYNADRMYSLGIKNIKADPSLTPRNKTLILKFAQYLLAKGTTKIRVRSVYFPKLKYICKTAKKDLDKFTKDDVANVMSEVESSSYSQGTKNHYVTVFKVFYRWHHNLNPEESPPKLVSWLKNHSTQPRVKREDLLTIEEIQSMISLEQYPMWKALIAFLWETACRPGELRSVKLKDINILPQKIKIYVRGKTKKKLGDRAVYVYKGFSLLTNWLQIHPGRSSPNSYLFTQDSGKSPITQPNLLKRVTRLGKRAKIQKHVFPYLFRHTRLTELYPKLGHLITQKFAGHSPNSKMISTYFHMNESDLEKTLDEEEGIQPQEQSKPLTCPRCTRQRSLGDQVCSFCGLAFKIKAAVHQSETIQVIPKKDLETILEFARLLNENPIFKRMAKDPRFIEQLADQKAKNLEQKQF